ncbi:hypothetical protein E4T43_04982 [Aureobasidium subglaciale]|nr:hypothetical protein E4T43_04982 [Aureobasidium subglaciale]
MDDLSHFDETMFQGDESLEALRSRVDPRFDPANAALKATCGHPPIHIHSQDDDALPNETIIFNILIELTDVPEDTYVTLAIDTIKIVTNDIDQDRNVSASRAAVAINAFYLSERPDPATRRLGSENYLYLVWSELFSWISGFDCPAHED